MSPLRNRGVAGILPGFSEQSPCRQRQGREQHHGQRHASHQPSCPLRPQPQFSTDDYRLAAASYPSQILSPWHSLSAKAFSGSWCAGSQAFAPLLLSSALPGEHYLPCARIKSSWKHRIACQAYFLSKFSLAATGSFQPLPRETLFGIFKNGMRI